MGVAMKGKQRFWSKKKVCKQEGVGHEKNALLEQFLSWNKYPTKTGKQLDDLKRLFKNHSWFQSKGFNSSTCLSALKGNFQ